MKLTKKDINAPTIVLASTNIAANIWWVTHKDVDHLPLIIINIIVALLLGALIVYIIRNK
jgi:intracellular septation protein A